MVIPQSSDTPSIVMGDSLSGIPSFLYNLCAAHMAFSKIRHNGEQGRAAKQQCSTRPHVLIYFHGFACHLTEGWDLANIRSLRYGDKCHEKHASKHSVAMTSLLQNRKPETLANHPWTIPKQDNDVPSLNSRVYVQSCLTNTALTSMPRSF